MVKSTGYGKIRRGHGFKPAGVVVIPIARQIVQKRGFGDPQLLAHWPDIVGADIAAIAKPSTMKFGRGNTPGTLTLVVSGAAASEVQMQSAEIMAKINAALGYRAVDRVRITHSARPIDDSPRSASHNAGRAQAMAEAPKPFTRHVTIDSPPDNQDLATALTRLAEAVAARSAKRHKPS